MSFWLRLAGQHGAWLVVDDAHGFGVLGARGLGALEHFGLRSRNIVYVGTLGKAAGVAGAFVAAHDCCIEWLMNRGRPYVYSTAPPPALACALAASLDIITSAEGKRRRENLKMLVDQLRAAARLRSWQLMPSRTPIQPVLVGENAVALSAAEHLRRQGLWVPAIRPPTVPAGTARLRISLSAAHSARDIVQLATALLETERACAGPPSRPCAPLGLEHR